MYANDFRVVTTLSSHSALRLADALINEKQSILDGCHPIQDGPEYDALLLQTLDTELQYLRHFFVQVMDEGMVQVIDEALDR